MLGLLFIWLEPRTRPEWYKSVLEKEERDRALEEENERVRQLRDENERLRERLRQAGLDPDA